METNQTESVAQTVESGASTENVNAETISKADLDFKRDMLKYKDEANALKERLKEIELSDEQKKGNFEGVISSLKDEIKNLKTKNAQATYNFANTQIDSAIRNEALSRGITGNKLDVLMRVVDENDKGAITLDDKFNVNNDDVKSILDKNMERYSDIFTKSVKVVDGTPNNSFDMSGKKLNFDKMTSSELKEYMLKNKDKLK